MTYTGAWHIVATIPSETDARGYELSINHIPDCPMSPTLQVPVCTVALEIVGHGYDAPAWSAIDKPGFYRARVLLDEGGASTVEVERMDMGEAMEALLGAGGADDLSSLLGGGS